MSEVLYEVDGDVAIITLNRPDRRNAITLGMLDALTAGLREADADPRVRCILLTGAGRAFCAGLDLVEAAGHSAAHATAKIIVPRERWVEVHEVLKEHLPFFSYLSAIDWSSEVAVGDPPGGDEVSERYEVMTRISDVDEGKALIVSTEILN